jgi:hypothetical protein
MRFVAILLVAVALSSCGGGSAPDGGRTRFLLLAHQQLGGALATQSDQRLLDVGNKACIEMDARTTSDRIVSDLGGGEPGSAEYNAYSFVMIAAATELCPAHKAEFGGGLPAG